MTLYTTTAVPSFDLLGGIDTLQRLLQSHTEIERVVWDERTQTTVAVLKTNGTQICLKAVADTLDRFKLPLIESEGLAEAIQTAKVMAHAQDVFELCGYKLEDTFSL